MPSLVPLALQNQPVAASQSSARSMVKVVSDRLSFPRLKSYQLLNGQLGSSNTNTYNPWSNIQTIDNSKTVILRAQNAKVPQVLGTIITTLP